MDLQHFLSKICEVYALSQGRFQKKHKKFEKKVRKIMNQETSGKGSENSWLVTQKVSTLAKGHVLFRAKVVHEVQ